MSCLCPGLYNYMSWLSFIDKVYLVNLAHREDRLLESAKLLEEYQIPYQVFPAIQDREQGARGLMNSMIAIFEDSLENEYENILVLEDDFKMIEDTITFHDVLGKAIKQLPENYHLLYLGGQPTVGYSHWHSDNLLPAIKYFATQSVIYSKQGIKEILALGMKYPIDNFFVDELQPMNRCYAIHPILCSQRPGFSDIGQSDMDWMPFIEPRHNQKVAEIGRKW